MSDNKEIGGGLFNDYQRPPPRASTAIGLMPVPSQKSTSGAVGGSVGVVGGGTSVGSSSGPTDFSKVIGGTVAVSDEVRSSPQYADWYYAQNPRDPRTPPPLIKGGKYGAPVARSIHGPIGSPVPTSASAAHADNSSGGTLGVGFIPTSQPPTIALSSAPKPNKYQPPSKVGGGGGSIPLSKPPTAAAAAAVGKQPAPPPSASSSSTGVTNTPSSVAESAKNAKPSTLTATNTATNTTTNTTKTTNNANNASSSSTTNALLAGLGRVSKAPSSIPDGEERWTDDLVEEPHPSTVMRPHYGGDLPPGVPAPPPESVRQQQPQRVAATTAAPSTNGAVVPPNGTVISNGQQFSLYARPFQPPTTTSPSVDPFVGMIGGGGAAHSSDSEESQFYAAMRSINATAASVTEASTSTPPPPPATANVVSSSPSLAGPNGQSFTPYPQPQYNSVAKSVGGGSGGTSPSSNMHHGGGGGGMGAMAAGAGGYLGGGGAIDSMYASDSVGGAWGYDGGNPAAGGVYAENDYYGSGGGRMQGGGMGGMMTGGGGRGNGMRGGRGLRGGGMNPNGGMMGGGSVPRTGRGGAGPQMGGPAAGGVVSSRSPFVEKFHLEHAVGAWRLSDVEGHVAEVAKDQEGSRFVQVQLDAAAQNGTLVRQLDDVLQELFVDQNTATDVICDVFGNYVVQKILEVASEDQLARIFQHLHGIIVNLTLQTYGCRVIQKAVEALRRYPHLLEGVIAELEPNVPRCVQDQNGNHVIQKLVEINPDGAGFIIDAFRGKVRELATHAYGCRVIQCILSQCPRYEPDIMRELFVCLPELTMDQYGNYVVQHVLQHGPQSYVDVCFDALKHRIYYCSRQKFASNVIEKLFHRCTRVQRQEFFDILCYCDPDVGATEQTTQQIQGKPLLSYFVLMMMDPFANYVVQKFVDEADEALRRQMMSHTMQYIDVLKAHHYGMHIINRFERSRYLPQGTSGNFPAGTNNNNASPNSNEGSMMMGGNGSPMGMNPMLDHHQGNHHGRGGGRGGRGGNNNMMGGGGNSGPRGGRGGGRGGRGGAPRGL